MKTCLSALVCGLLAGSVAAATEVVDGVPWTYHITSGQAVIECDPQYWCWDEGVVVEEEQCPPFSTPLKACDKCHGRGTGCARYEMAAIPDDTRGTLRVPSTLGGKPVKQIGRRAFAYCSSLTEIILPEGVTTIAAEAFYNCDGVILTLPSTFTCKAGCGSTIFHDAHIRAFHVADGHPSLRVINGFLCTKDGKTLLAAPCPLQTEVVPNSVTTIAPGAFDTFGWDYTVAHQRYTLKLPKGLKTIGAEAFAYSELVEVELPEGVTSVGASAFEGCTHLERIVFPSTLKTIERYTAAGVNDELEVQLPEGVTTLREHAFGGSNIPTVTVPASVQTIEGGALPAKIFFFSGKPPARVHARAFDAHYGDETYESELKPGEVETFGVGYYPIQFAAAWEKVLDPYDMWHGLKMNPNFVDFEDEPWYKEGDLYLYRGGVLYRELQDKRLEFLKILDTTLTSITITKEVILPTLDQAALFDVCPNLTAINVEAGHPTLTSHDGLLYEKSSGGVLYLRAIPRAIRSFTIPRACTVLDPFSLYLRACTKLTSIKVASGHSTAVVQGGVLYRRFYEHLEPIAILPSVTAITLPKETRIRNWDHFAYITGLAPRLATIKVEQGHEDYLVSGNILCEKRAESDFVPCAIPPACTSITIDPLRLRYFELGPLVARSPKLSSMKLSAKDPYATIKDGILYLAYDAKRWEMLAVLPTLKTVKIPKSCTNIPESINATNDTFFTVCPNLTAFEVEPGNPNYLALDGVLYHHVNNFPDTLLAIPNKKATVTVPETVTAVKHNAYRGKTSLELIFAGKPPAFGGFGYTVWDCPYEDIRTESEADVDATIYYSDTYRTEWEKTLKGVPLWCGYAVAERTPAIFTYRVVGKSVTLTGLAPHDRSETLFIPEKLDGKPVTAIADNAFRNATWLKRVYFPNAITSIGKDAFAGCSALNVQNVTLPTGLKNLGRGAFTGCIATETLTMVPGTTLTTACGNYKVATAPSGFKFDTKRGTSTATFTKPGTYDAVLFSTAGRIAVLRYIVTELPTVTITCQGGDANCKVTGEGSYFANTKVTLVATVPKYATFVGWFENDTCCSTNKRCTFTMGASSRALVAKFVTEPLTLTVTSLFTFYVVGDPVSIGVSCNLPASELKSIKATRLPAGLTFSKVGDQYQISGVPTKAGEGVFTIQAVAKSGVTTTKTFTATINKEPVKVAFFDEPEDVVTTWPLGLALDVFAETGLKRLTAKGLPPGVKLVCREGKWYLEGTPTKGGTYNITFTATSKLGSVQTFTLPLEVQVIPDAFVGCCANTIYYYDPETDALIQGRGYVDVDEMGYVYGWITFFDGAMAEIDTLGKVLTKSETCVLLEVKFNFYDTQGKKSLRTMELYLVETGSEADILP